jgi:hypothetical protein
MKHEEEIRVFRDFIARVGLAVLHASVQKRYPPEPDILCQFEDGTQVAFELTEVCHPANAAFFFSAPALSEVIEKTYRYLPTKLRNDLDSRFSQQALSFRFQSGATRKQIRNKMPRIFAELSQHPEETERFELFSPSVKRVLDSIWLRGRSYPDSGPWFNIGGVFSSDDVVQQSIMAKLGKEYATPNPIELVAYFGAFAFSKDGGWKEPLRGLLDREGLKPFRRIWVLGPDALEFVYPSPD